MMRWGDKTIQFVRPVFTVTLLLDGDLVPAHILGIDSARTIRGHRFMGESDSPSTTPASTRRSCRSAAW